MCAALHPAPESRRTRFRRLMAQLDAAGDPARAFDDGQYRPSHHAVGDRIAARLEIDPKSTHILIGGVGSGKTTELLRVKQKLAETSAEDTECVYIDATTLDIFGRSSSTFASAVTQVLAARRGESLAPWEDRAGALDDAASAASRSVVLLLDGLDRLDDLRFLVSIVRHDIGERLAPRFGIVLVAPLHCLYGIERTIAERFDEQHYQPWVDPGRNPQFLYDVLRARVGEAIADDALELLVKASGGVLRDLLTLAQGACVEAYAGAPDRIEAEQARIAIDSFGRRHLMGVRSHELDCLQRVRVNGTFVQTSEDDLALLMSRRVLEYRNDGGVPKYAVHPTIEPLLRAIKENESPF